MCQTTPDGLPCVNARRELRYAGGRIVQCLQCRSIGVEFGTSYLVFSERDFIAFARWFETLRWDTNYVDRGRLHIQICQENSLMLSLARCEMRAVTALLSEGIRWIASGGPVAETASTRDWPATGATIH